MVDIYTTIYSNLKAKINKVDKILKKKFKVMTPLYTGCILHIKTDTG